MSACECEVRLGATRLRVAPLRVGHLLEIERKILEERRDPLALLAER